MIFQPSSFAYEDLLQSLINPENPFLKNPMTIEQTLLKYITMEYLSSPLVLKELYRIVREYSALTTVAQGPGEFINVTDQFYPVKRIRNLKLLEINYQLWVLVQQAKEKELIKIFIELGSDEQRVLDLISQALCLDRLTRDSGLYRLNQEIARQLYREFMAKKFQPLITEELDQRSKKEIMIGCQKELLKTINLNSYKHPAQISIVTFCSDKEDRVYACFVNQQGQLKDFLVLPHFIKCSLSKDPQLKNLMEQDRNKLFGFL